MQAANHPRLSSLASLHQHHAPSVPCVPPPVSFNVPLHVSAQTPPADIVVHFMNLGAFWRVFHLLLEAPLEDDASQCCAHLPMDEPRAITQVQMELIPAFLDFFRAELHVLPPPNGHRCHSHPALHFKELPAIERILATYSHHADDARFTVALTTQPEATIGGAELLWHYMLSELLVHRATLEFQNLATLGGAYAALGNAEKALYFAHEQKRTAATMRNTRLYYISDVYITYYYISKRNFQLAADRLRETLRCVKELRDPVVRLLFFFKLELAHRRKLLRVVYSAFMRLAVHQERAEGIRPHFPEVPPDLDEQEFFYGQLRW